MDEYEHDDEGPYLVWEEITVMVKSNNIKEIKVLINQLSGYAKPNRIMALMGPSGDAFSGIYFFFNIYIHIFIFIDILDLLLYTYIFVIVIYL